MNANEKRRWIDELIQTVERLAAPADAQRAYLVQLGVEGLTDELALEFDDSYVLVAQFVKEGLISPEQAAALRALDEKLDDMSGPDQPLLWRPEGLDEPEWTEVRQRAGHALSLLRPLPRTRMAKAS